MKKRENMFYKTDNKCYSTHIDNKCYSAHIDNKCYSEHIDNDRLVKNAKLLK